MRPLTGIERHGQDAHATNRAALAAAWLVLALPLTASAQTLGVVPILIGPLQVLLAILPAMLVALGGALIAMFKPSAIKAGAKMLWRNKVPTVLIVAGVVGLVYAWQFVFPSRSQAATAAVAGKDWPAMRGGDERRGFSGQGDDPTAGGQVWSFKTKKAKTFHSSPAVVGNRVYVTSADKGPFKDRGAVYCLDADNGAMVWEYSPDGFRATYSSPSVWKKYLVVGEGLHFTRDARINCLDAQTGKLLWEVRTASHVESSPCIADGKAYIGAGDDGLWCVALEPKDDKSAPSSGPAPTSGVALEPKGGQANVLWHLSGKEYPDCETSPIVADGKVYFGMGESGQAVACVKADTGELVWRTSTPYPVFSAPVLSDGKLFVGMGNGNLVEPAETVRSKKLDKLRKAGTDEAKLAEIAKTLGPGGEVWCLDPASGKKIWDFKLPQTILGIIAAADKRLYFGSQNGAFYCLTTDKQVVYQREVHEPIVTSAAVGNEHVYFLTGAGRLYGLDRKRNQLAWQATVGTGGMYLSSPAVGRGHVYVGTELDGLLCIGQVGQPKAPVWAGYLGGNGQSGWADGSPLPDKAEFAWRWPKNAADGQVAILSPVAYLDRAIYLTFQNGDKAGLIKLTVIKKEDATSQPATAASRSARTTREDFVEEWTFPTALPPGKSVALMGGKAYLADGKPGQPGRSLYCVDIATGKETWKASLPDTALAELLATEGGLYLFDAPDRLSCIGTSGQQAGETLWSVQTGPAVGAPAEADSLILVSTTSPPGVTAIDPKTQKPAWQANLPSVPTSGPVGNKDMIAVGTAGGVFCLTIVDGSVLWQAAGAVGSGPIAIDDNRLALTTAGGEVLVLDWRGQEVLRLPKAVAGLGPMLVGDAMLYVKDVTEAASGDDSGPKQEIWRVDFSSGLAARWLRQGSDFLGPVTAPPVLVDSNLYLGTGQKGLVCARQKR